nr:hypothetical protein [Tanacetum cinerariifolium]
MTLSSTLKASDASCICPLVSLVVVVGGSGGVVVVGSSRSAFTIPGQMTSLLTVVTLCPYVGVPPRQGTSFKSTPCKLNLTCDSAIADNEDKFYLFYPLGQTNDPFSTFEIHSLTLQEISKMAPNKRTMRSTPATTTTPTTTVIYAQLQAQTDRGVVAASAKHDADRSRNGDNINDSGTGRRRQTIRGNLKILQETNKTNISHLTAAKTNNISHSKGIMWNGLTLLGLEIRSLVKEPNLYVPSAIITKMGSVYQSVPTVRRLVIWPGIVKADLLLPTTTTPPLPPTTTTREPKGQIQEASLALSVEFK